MLDVVYRNLSEEQSSMARLYRKQKPALLPARVSCLDQPFSAA
jgi:predicted protein tyrosine phosphatase